MPAPAPFAADAVSYAVSALSLLFIRTPFSVERATPPGTLGQEMWEGARWLGRHPLVRLLAVRAAGINFVLNGTYLLVIVIARAHHSSPALIVVMIALGGIGGLAGTFAAPAVQRRFRLGTIVLGASWLEALLYPLFAVAPGALTLGVVYAALLVLIPASNAAVLSYRLSLIPPELQGRVNSVARLIGYGTVPLGTAVAGILLQVLTGTQAILVYAAIMLLVAIAVTSNPQMRAARTT
jgi:predicted MFS family arabinose efflux permease